MFHCPGLLIPVVNEIFEENYTGDEKVEFGRSEYLRKKNEEDTEKRINDSHFKIIGEEERRFHVEVESRWDRTITLRMFEYDIGIAMEESEHETDKNELIIMLPKSAVIYLRHTKHTPDKMNVVVRAPEGELTYQIPVIKMKKYTLDELLEKNLLLLLPFYIFCFEKELPAMEKDEKELERLKADYIRIRDHLEELCEKGELNEYEKHTIISMIKCHSAN